MSKVGRAATVGSKQRVETLGNGTAAADAKVISADETGEIYLIDHNHAGALTITLPPMRNGAYFKFLFKTDFTADGTVVINSNENVAGDFAGAILEQVTGGSDAATAMVICGSHDILTLNDDIDPGSWVECVCDGSQWIWSGVISVDAVGKAVFSS